MKKALRDDKYNDQLLGVFIDSLNKNSVLNRLDLQNTYLENALQHTEDIRSFIGAPENILGSDLTKHGEIAERVEVGVRKAKDALHGINPTASFDLVGRTAPEDYIINNLNVQSKFINGVNNTLRSVTNHLEKYPDFTNQDAYYHIAKDQHEIIIKVLNGENVEQFNSRTKEAIIRNVQNIENKTGKSFTTVVQPGISNYDEVQQFTVHNTIDKHEQEIKTKNTENLDDIQKNPQPNVSDALKATGAAAAVGATVSLTTALYAKSKEGKRFYKGEFSQDDWQDVGITSIKGGMTGGVSGASIYYLTNYAGLSAPFAGAVVSASKGVQSLYSDYHSGDIVLDEFYELAMILCSESAIVGFATVAGQGLIPIPALGAIIGSLAGTLLANALGADNKVTSHLIQKDLNDYLAQLDERSRELVNQITEEFEQLGDLTTAAFNIENNQKLLELSFELALAYGVEEADLLNTTDDIDDFMLS